GQHGRHAVGGEQQGRGTARRAAADHDDVGVVAHSLLPVTSGASPRAGGSATRSPRKPVEIRKVNSSRRPPGSSVKSAIRPSLTPNTVSESRYSPPATNSCV